MADVVKIDDNAIKALLTNSEARRTFPFLATTHKRMQHDEKSCKPCQRKQRNNTTDYESVKLAIGVMPLKDKAKLRKILGGSKVEVTYVQGKKRVTAKF